jgi:hypothetical protein
MKKIGLIFIMIFVFLTTFGQEINKNLAKLVKNNGVKSIKEYLYRFNKGKVISSELYEYKLFDRNGNLVEQYGKHWTEPTIKYKYDSAGNLIEKVRYDSKGSKRYIETWEYDRDGRLLKRISNINGQIFTDNYTYNEQGQNIEKYDIDKQGEKYRISTMKYYDSGELFEKRFENKEYVRIERFDKCGNLIYKSEYGQERIIDVKYIDSCKVDSSAYILQADTIQYVENEKELTKITELQVGNERNIKVFDNKGNLIIDEIYEHEKDGTLRYSNTSFFNEQGQVIEKKTFFAKTYEYRVDSKYHFKYEYYDNGLKKFVYSFDENGVKKQYSEYKIEYY